MAEDEPIHTLSIAGKDYEIDALNDVAKTEIRNLRFAEAELQRLTAQMALAQTARNAYMQALIAALPVEDEQT